jgi:hypothetical protein
MPWERWALGCPSAASAEALSAAGRSLRVKQKPVRIERIVDVRGCASAMRGAMRPPDGFARGG